MDLVGTVINSTASFQVILRCVRLKLQSWMNEKKLCSIVLIKLVCHCFSETSSGENIICLTKPYRPLTSKVNRVVGLFFNTDKRKCRFRTFELIQSNISIWEGLMIDFHAILSVFIGTFLNTSIKPNVKL